MIIKTFNLTAGKTNKVELTDEHSFFIVGYAWVINNTSDDVYISLNADMAAESDGTAKVSSGSIGMLDIDGAHKNLYAIGNGKIEVRVTSEAICPFKSTSKGGEATSDAKTVNGHTVESDVPADAKFTDTTNSDITATGNPVQLDGLQGGVPFSEIAVSGKNLLKYPYYNTTKTISGITFTDNGDGTITANGTATATASYFLDSEFNYIGGITYTISGCPKGGSNSTYKIKGDRLGAYIDDNGNGATYSFKYDTTAAIVILIYKDTTVDNIVFRPQLEYGDTATAYEPPITGQNITLWACKKNLMCYPYWVEKQGGTLENNGITYTLNADMSISANGTATADSYCILQHLTMSPNVNRLIKNTDYFFSGTPAGGSEYTYRMYAGIYDNDGNRIEIYHDYGSGVSIKIANDYRCAASILIKKGQTVSNLIFRPQLELGSAATDYEMPSGTSYTITPDSNPYTVPNDIRQQDGLNTISVSAGTLSVKGVRKNAAIKRIWDSVGMDLLFDGVTSADNPAVVNLANYNMIRIDVGGNYEGTSYFNCGSTYFSKNTLDFAVTSYGYVAIPLSNQAVIISISKSGAEYSLSFSGFNEKQRVDVIKIYGIK